MKKCCFVVPHGHGRRSEHTAVGHLAQIVGSEQVPRSQVKQAFRDAHT